MSYDALIAPIREWLIDQALDDCDIVELFDEMCKRIIDVGIPLSRARIFWPTLHPLFQGETILWEHDKPAKLDQFEHSDKVSDEWVRSPLRFLVENKLEMFRRRLTGLDAQVDFDILEELKETGITDYLLLGTTIGGTAFRVREGQAGFDRGILVVFCTKDEDGFSDDQISALKKIQRRFAVACKTSIQSRITQNITTTYLGNRPGEYVLDGQIRRGDGQQTNAVVWFSDLRNSTALAENMEPEAYFDLLNSYFSATAEPIVQNGGEVLDFIGDAVLGIFPYGNDDGLEEAAASANRAISQALRTATQINQARKLGGLATFNHGIAVSVGTVMFGNIGIPSRLTFSVISPTVNEASKIEQLTKMVGHSVLAHEAFAKLNPELWETIGQYSLNGVGHDTEVFKFIGNQK